MQHVITIDNVCVRYGHFVALQDVSGCFHKGSLTAISGPNGAGKSTFLKLIVGMVRPQKGRVLVQNRTSIAYLPQASSMHKEFPLTVLQAVCTGFSARIGNAGGITSDMKAQALRAIDEVGLGGLDHRQVRELSGGQFQRLLFARLIIQDCNLILLDEPFTAVDAETTARLIQIILRWHREGRTIVCVLHDLLLIQKYFPDSFVLAGKCLGHGHTHKLLQEKLLSFDLDMAELCSGESSETHYKCDHDCH